MAIDILIAGVQKTSSAQVEYEVRRVVRETRTKSNWRFTLLPSGERQGLWDVGLRGPNGWAITWFDATPEDLPSRTAATLRQLLQT